MKFTDQTKTRLKRLIHVMKNVQKNRPKQFDITNWKVCKVKANGQVSACGTSACALGEAASDPVLQKEGLELIADTYGNRIEYTPIFRTQMMTPEMRKKVVVEENHDISQVELDDENQPRYDVEPTRKNIINGKANSYVSMYDAGELFFGITPFMSNWLFNPSEYILGESEGGDLHQLLPELYVKKSKEVTPELVVKRVEHLLKRYG